ncbi:wax ester/triacylglycerol synthase domain-containing protein [Streptomyces sp. ISL-11]|uniref:wax ester/triacylglycerol synthase domain-containing protein n=1 Tax=Streptomyces sp. ISL-11 TaxID=2819174 RepID=UPI001BE4F012|nr:wax ester/triacylglycerol synthase domain-containing protein [Streptomyces sp. ISL-11]MBT2385288.1 DUF1298 domain-containing protein [Streptomyces sp. ISL-11]
MDTLFWRMGSDARLRLEVVWVWFLDRAPDWSGFLAGCDWMTRALPRLRHRVVDSWQVGIPVWSPDTEFRLSRHVHRVYLPAPGGLRELLDLVEWRASAALDRGHPLWEATLVEGYDDGRAAVVLKWHHAIGDALGIQIAMRELLPQSPEAGRPSPAHTAAFRHTASGAGKAVEPESNARSAIRNVRTAVMSMAGEAIRSLSAPQDAGERALRLGRHLGQVVSPVMPSPLLRKRSLELRCGLVSVPLADLKAAGKSAGVSVTSAYLAAILGAFHKYHVHHGLHLKSIPVMLPVSIREPFQTGGGNFVAAVRIAGPVGDMGPLARMQAVHRSVVRARGDLIQDMYPALAGVSSWIPRSLIGMCAPLLAKSIDLVVTSVPGLSQDTYVTGARIVDAVPWVARGPAAANITTASHGNMCGIGTNLDPAAITDTKMFHHLLRQSFEDLFSASGS